MNKDPKYFYVTLLSTPSQHIYPNNTHYDFIVELAQNIDLGNNDKREVGLSEYAWPRQNLVPIRPLRLSGNPGL
jgi:hypothetical protein